MLFSAGTMVPLSFLSTLSLRRATYFQQHRMIHAVFLSTLSLRRATEHPPPCVCYRSYFYPRSPCGERRQRYRLSELFTHISIHALLAESDACGAGVPDGLDGISIHALLAESDCLCCWFCAALVHHFYPRSPCGERPFHPAHMLNAGAFLSTLSLRRATPVKDRNRFDTAHFYPRSPCGERLQPLQEVLYAISHFYPRSPCGERRPSFPFIASVIPISIHALLAESDYRSHYVAPQFLLISIHALLAESDEDQKV